MAYDLGTGLSGAAQGAAMGSMIPGVGPGIGTAIGGVLGLGMGFFGGGEGETQQVNPYSQSYWDMASQNMANYQKQMGSAMDQQEGFLGQAGDAFGQMQNFRATAQFDPSAAMRMTNAQLPQIERMAEASMGTGGLNPDQLRNRMESTAQSTAAQFNRMGGLGSGAAMEAIGQGVAGVQAENDIRNQQMYQQAFLNQLGQAGQMNLQGLQQQFAGRQASDQLRFQGLSGAAGGYAGLGQQMGQRASMFGNLAGQSQASMASMAGPEFVYQQPDNPAQDIMSGIGTGFGIYQLGQENQQRQEYIDMMAGMGKKGTDMVSSQGLPTLNSGNPYDNPFINENQTYRLNQVPTNLPTMSYEQAMMYRQNNPQLY